MAIIRKWVAQNDSGENQWLKVDHPSRFIVNHTSEWQPIFGVDSALVPGAQVLKLAAQLDTSTLDEIRLVGYLYNPASGAVDSAATVVFYIYKVTDITTPRWDDQLISTQTGDVQSNNYYFKSINISSLSGVNLDGDTTLMVEGVATRLGITYRDRIYVNHLGVYDSIVRLRNDVEFLDITKLDE